MTNKELLNVVQILSKELDNFLSSHPTHPTRDYPNLPHLSWMLDQIPDFLLEGKREKAMRWLGFVQGALWWLGMMTIDELKNMNKP
jgi:hypothetical protein